MVAVSVHSQVTSRMLSITVAHLVSVHRVALGNPVIEDVYELFPVNYHIFGTSVINCTAFTCVLTDSFLIVSYQKIVIAHEDVSASISSFGQCRHAFKGVVHVFTTRSYPCFIDKSYQVQ